MVMAVTVGSSMAVVNGNGNSNSNSNSGDDLVWPPGFRFHPTDEELVLYYLKRKLCRRKIKLDIIREMDVYKWDPEELPEKSLLKTGDRQWFFFSPRDRKYPNGARSNRATQQGYWKSTGKDRNITCNSRNVGVKKTLVFYKGRAPNVERTDWVMHEYTMDEEELSRCPNVQDYYALYKLFKKSGPGPKNGEQYGAPFKEEEWDDDKCGDIKDSITEVSFANQPVEVAFDNNDGIILPVEKSIDELDELLKQFADVPELDGLLLNCDAYSEPQVSGQQMQNTAVDSLLSEVTFSEPDKMLMPSGLGHEREASFDFNGATASMLPPDGGPEFVFTHNNFEEAPQLTLEDFLEIDDLIGSQPTFANIEGSGESLHFDGFGGHCKLYLHHDGEVFLHDPNQTYEETFSFNMASLGNEMENQVGCPVQPFLGTNQGGIGLQSHSVVSEADFEFQPELFFDDQIANQLKMQDQANGSFSSPIQGSLSQSDPGIEYPVASNPPVANQNINGEPGNGVNSRFASSMWSFLESIPSNPASASENHLVNKALERMSSFSRLRMNVKSPNVVVGSVAGNGRKASVSRSFVLLSILGVLCAILWVSLMGTKVVLGRSVSS